MSAAAPIAGVEPASTAAIFDRLAAYGQEAGAEVGRYLKSAGAAPFLDELLADYPSRGGKMLRPAICMANARVFGGDSGAAVRCAAAIEILHNGLLIHDDIQDFSETRRGRPTLHRLHGMPLAINAGDALMFAALRPLVDALRHLGSAVASQVLEASMTMARETAEGQALELGWRDCNVVDLTEADYFRMALKKTAWMGMIWPSQLGLIVGSRGRGDPQSVMRFGYFLGIAFQIEDDLRNLSDDPGYGKERNGDLYEATRTLMLIHARAACGPRDRERLDAFLELSREARSAEDVAWLAELMGDLGSIDHGRLVAAAMAGACPARVPRWPTPDGRRCGRPQLHRRLLRLGCFGGRERARAPLRRDGLHRSRSRCGDGRGGRRGRAAPAATPIGVRRGRRAPLGAPLDGVRPCRLLCAGPALDGVTVVLHAAYRSRSPARPMLRRRAQRAGFTTWISAASGRCSSGSP